MDIISNSDAGDNLADNLATMSLTNRKNRTSFLAYNRTNAVAAIEKALQVVLRSQSSLCGSGSSLSKFWRRFQLVKNFGSGYTSDHFPHIFLEKLQKCSCFIKFPCFLNGHQKVL
jgi:hypothetical protein